MKTIAFIAPKQRIGTTSAIVSLAKAIVAKEKKSVLLLNLSDAGDLSYHISKRFNWINFKDIAAAFSKISKDKIFKLVETRINGIGLIENDGNTFDKYELLKLTDLFQKKYDYLLIDCGKSFGCLKNFDLAVNFLIRDPFVENCAALSCFCDDAVETVYLENDFVGKLLEKITELQIKPKKENCKTGDILSLKKEIYERFHTGFDLNRSGTDKNSAKLYAEGEISKIVESYNFHDNISKDLKKDLINEILMMGPLEELLLDPEITEIMVNSKDAIYIEKNGKISKTDKRFINDHQLLKVIERIIAPIGRRIDESSPMVDARLANGERVNIAIPPVSLCGPVISIRKFLARTMTMDELIDCGTLNEKMAEYLKCAVLQKKNIMISGGTGSGKTTFLNALSSLIDDSERIITIEDSAELKLSKPNLVRLEARQKNIEGFGEITIRELLKNSLRMRPDRIIIGECRGAEAIDMLQAMNTGHSGSMTTIHSNSTHDSISRLSTLVLFSGIDIPVRAVLEMIKSSIDIIIHIKRNPDGSRKVFQVSEVSKETGEKIVLVDKTFD